MTCLQPRNLTMMTDLYQLTMMYGYFKHGMTQNEAVFDLFFRERENSAYAMMAGTESVVEYINNLHFTEDDIAYLRSLNLFDEGIPWSTLLELRFTGEIYAMKEGTVVFPNGTAAPRESADYAGSACRNSAFEPCKPPNADCNKGKPRCRAASAGG